MPIADFSLAGKVAIVTGGSRGIGKSIALALAEAGADVCVAARKMEALEETLGELNATGRKAIAVPTNVRDMDALENLVNETKRQLGRVDILVNNAATNPIFGPVKNMETMRSRPMARINSRKAQKMSSRTSSHSCTAQKCGHTISSTSRRFASAKPPDFRQKWIRCSR